MANNFFYCNKLIGGTAGTLDDINHSSVSDGDSATVTDAINDITYTYTYNSSSATAESSPDVIKPDSNGGNGRWILVDVVGASLEVTSGTLKLPNGTTINELSTDGTFAGNSDDAVPTEKAVKTYVDTRSSYVKVSDVKASGVAGGGFDNGAWRTRDINTEDSDDDSICSLAANQITLSAGDYECRISAPAIQVSNHKLKLRNITGGADILIGTSEYSSNSGAYAYTRSFVVGKFTIAAAQALEVQHYAHNTKITDGFGLACSFGVDEVYTIAEFWKVG